MMNLPTVHSVTAEAVGRDVGYRLAIVRGLIAVIANSPFTHGIAGVHNGWDDEEGLRSRRGEEPLSGEEYLAGLRAEDATRYRLYRLALDELLYRRTGG